MIIFNIVGIYMILMKLKKLLNQALDYMISYFISWGILQATNEFITCMVKYFYENYVIRVIKHEINSIYV